MPVTFTVVGNLADFGNDVRAGVKVRATATPGIKVGDVAIHSNQPEPATTDETGAFTLELVSLPGVWYRIQTPYSNAINTVNLAGYIPDVGDPTTGVAFPADTVINLKDVVSEDPTPGYEAIAYTLGDGGGTVLSVNGDTGVVVLTAADVGAATTAQGVKADTAVQPADLTAYATDAELTAGLATKAASTHTHVATTDLTATGTKDSTTFLRGDNTWAVPAGGGGGVTDHGGLTGLGDDDHTIYALADGTRGSFAAPLGADDNYVTDAQKAALHGHSNLASLDLTTGTNTGDQAWGTLPGKPSTFPPETHTHDDRYFTETESDARFATTAQGALADSATQPGDLSTVATTGAYGDLTGTPTLGTAAATASTAYATAAQGATADSAIQPGDDAADLGSAAATDGYVLTADGSGGSAWEAASGGGGGAGVPPVVIGGTYTAPPGYHVITRDIPVTATSGTARYYPMRLDAPWEITAVGISVATLASGSLVHVALYDDVSNDMTPGTRIAAPSGAGFSGATTGAKEVTGLSITLAAGNYVWVIVGESGSPVLTGYRIAAPFMSTGINNQLATGVEKSGATIPPPTTGQAPSGVTTGSTTYAGAIWLKGIPA